MDLSIVVAAYNVEDFIEKCVLSCFNQDILKDRYEILVVNDGSSDNTFQKLQRLSLSIDNLKIVNQQNGGLGAVRNTGLKEAIGDYLWFIDGDDYIHENCIEILIDNIKKDKLDVLFLNYAIVNEAHLVVNPSANQIDLKKNILSGGEFYNEFYSKSYSWLYVFKKSLLIDNNILFKERINMQDSEIMPKIMFYANRISYLNLVAYYYYQQENSFTNSTNGQKRYNYFISIIEVRNSLLELLESCANNNILLAQGIENKIKSLNMVVFNHLVYFKYDAIWFKKIINLLKENNFYPLKNNLSFSKKIFQLGLNRFPLISKKIIDKLLNFYN